MGHDYLSQISDNFIAAKPQIDEHASSPESMIVQEDDTLAIWCNVSGTPAPEVTWFRLLGQDDPPVGKDTPVGKHQVPLVRNFVYVCACV